MLTKITVGIRTAGTVTTGPAMKKMMTRKISTNGKSISADKLAEVKKSRNVSYCCTLLAKAPEDCGPAAILIDRMCSKMAEETLRSKALPALSRNTARMERSAKSNT
jgi:hypothetical protein